MAVPIKNYDSNLVLALGAVIRQLAFPMLTDSLYFKTAFLKLHAIEYF